LPIGVTVVVWFGGIANAQQGRQESSPSEDIETIVEQANQFADSPLSGIDRPAYRAVQEWKKELNEKYGINWALEDTLIYQAASSGDGGVDPNDAMVNTLGLFGTWKIFRSENGKEFGGIGFQAEARQNPFGEFTDMAADLGTIWSPNDSTSDDYARINQLWWGQKLSEGRIAFQVGKIDPGAHINGNRFAGSGNTQFFGQPFATNPARSFPANGLGFLVRGEPSELLYVQYVMSDSDAEAAESPFKTLNGRWLYAGEVGLRPVFDGMGQGTYRLTLYQRDAESANEFGWALSADQNLSDTLGVFLRYGGNDGDLNAIEHLVSCGVSFLQPFGRKSDQAGVGVSYTHPADAALRDEYSTEVYYRMRMTEGFELSGSAQLIANPSASDRDVEAVFGLRARVLY
jgi:porin